MNVDNRSAQRKQCFSVKTGRRDGLVLQIHHTIDEKKSIRFINACFNGTGQILAACTIKGDVYIFNFTYNKFWLLTNITSCTLLKFSLPNDLQVFIGNNNGDINIINVETGLVVFVLKAHKYPVHSVSFATEVLCVSSSPSEAIIWDLRNYTKMQMLHLSSEAALKQVLFMPVSNNLLTCFSDDSIYIWKYATFDTLKHIHPASWNKFQIKCITFTKNGRVMVLGGCTSHLAVFLVDTWKLEKTVTLPNVITGVKKLAFISQPFDGGANRILSILSGNGILYFYDMLLDEIVNQTISFDVEISKYTYSADGRFIACVFTTGWINVYLLAPYTLGHLSTPKEKKEDLKVKGKQQVCTYRKCTLALHQIKEQINDVLDIQKLLLILKEFGEYPEAYRLKIWTQLLHLPNNVQQFNVLNQKYAEATFEDLEKRYPMENKIALKNLKKLLFSLTLWCPFFGEVLYLPLFAFPFVKIFQNDPVICFEAVATIIVNWCQHWFEYYPLPPINVLAMTENVLLQHDPALLNHLSTYEITSKLYAWPLMETVFSEVLSAQDWLTLWDHIFSNEPSFLLMIVVSYSITQRKTLLSMTKLEDFHLFYHKQNLVDVKKLLSKAYCLLETTETKYHPRQYLEYFRRIEIGTYPQFVGFPKIVVDYQGNSKELRAAMKLTEDCEKEIMKRTAYDRLKVEEAKRNIEESIRIKELERLYKKKLEEDIEAIKKQKYKLDQLRKIFKEEQSDPPPSPASSSQKTSELLSSSFDMTKNQGKPARTGEAIKLYKNFLEISFMVQTHLAKGFDKNLSPEDFTLAPELHAEVFHTLAMAVKMGNGTQYMTQIAATTGLALLEKLIKTTKKKLNTCDCDGSDELKHNFVKFMMEQIEGVQLKVEKALTSLSKVKKPDDEHVEFNELKQEYEQIKAGLSAKP